jgi:hypothetical protein
MDLIGWPAGMRVIARKERPHPGAQLRITDVDGNRITAFATNTPRGQLADLELRHRRRARCEDRIRGAKDTGLANLPLHDFASNQIWCALVALALAGRPSDQHAARAARPGITRGHRPPTPPTRRSTVPDVDRASTPRDNGGTQPRPDSARPTSSTSTKVGGQPAITPRRGTKDLG